MRILSIHPTFPRDLNSTRNLYLWHSLEALQKINVEPILLLPNAWKPFQKKCDRSQFPMQSYSKHYFSIPRHYFRAISNLFCRRAVTTSIRKIIQSHDIDVIHAHGEIAGFAALKIAKQLHIPLVVTIHGVDMCARLWKGLPKKMCQRVLNEADRIIFVGEPLQSFFYPMMNHTDHCRVVHNGFRMPSTLSSRNTGENIRIISVSNLNEGKGVDLNLLALAKLKNNGVTNWHYTIVGDGEQRKLCETIVAQHRLETYVTFVGECSHDVVYHYLQQSDLFCLPSYREAFGIAYIEAMAHGLLTIGVEEQGPAAFIEHNKTGFLVKPNDVADLAQTLQAAIQNFRAFQSIAESGKEHVLSQFSLAVQAEKLRSIYTEL